LAQTQLREVQNKYYRQEPVGEQADDASAK
jgi:hypothetical protein